MSDAKFDEITKLVCDNVVFVLNQCKSNPDMFTHYAMLVNFLGRCYVQENNNAVILANIDGDLAIMSVNATEMDVTNLMNESHAYVMRSVMEDAPEKSMFN